MKCYYHPELDAVASCQHCGKHLCKECADKYSPILCDDCYKKLRQEEHDRLREARSRIENTIIISILVAIAAFFICIFFIETGIEGAIIATLIAFFAPFGWNYANLLGLTWFFNMNPAGCLFMVIVYLFRAILASIIGVFCFIAAIVKYREIVKAEKTAEIEMM